MHLEYPQLAALVAVVRTGSFDAAARALHVTASAVSQRIKQLEEQVGGIVVVRASPCHPTATGEALYRHGLQVELLEKDLLRTMGRPVPSDEPGGPISIAANADSLATWLVPALTRFAAETGLQIETILDDQDHTAGWLRSGHVLGAVTAEAQAIQGCRVHPLGVMRYRAAASPAFVRRFFPDGFTRQAVRRAPVLVFDRKDHLHERYARSVLGGRWVTGDLRAHYVPSPTAYVEACRAGLGWGLHPESLIHAHLKTRRLHELIVGRWVDVPLYWQQWTLASHSLDALAATLRAEATNALRPQ